MHDLPAVTPRGITLAIDVPDSTVILEVIVRLALRQPIRIIVGGNRFDAHKLARLIRRHTIQLDDTLARIQQARPFTCYQVVALLKVTPTTLPLVALDMLTTFYDENISDAESVRLVTIAITHLQRLSQSAPVLVTCRSSVATMRPGLIKMIEAVADDVYQFDAYQSDSSTESFQPMLGSDLAPSPFGRGLG